MKVFEGRGVFRQEMLGGYMVLQVCKSAKSFSCILYILFIYILIIYIKVIKRIYTSNYIAICLYETIPPVI